jgi:hypothetical protein
MCWSGEASAALALGGFASTAYFYKKGEPAELCAALGYFSGMEALQAFTYSVINQCSNPSNQVATMLGYLHIAFQPFFVNAVSMHFVPKPVRDRIRPFVYGLCFLGALLFIMRLYPWGWMTPCYEITYNLPFCPTCSFHIPFCGKNICSVSGAWHIAWQIPARYNYFLDNTYLIAAFFMPVLYGSWRMTVYHIISGPLLAWATTKDANEWAAVWCLYSIALLGLMIKSPIRKVLYVRQFPLWHLIPGAMRAAALEPVFARKKRQRSKKVA